MSRLWKTLLPLAFLVLAPLAVFGDDKLDALIKQLADKKPETQIAACKELESLGEEAAPAGAAIVETMLRAGRNPDVFQAASDALEKVAPKVQPHVLTIMLNDDSKGQLRLGGAKQIGDLGAAGAAGLPVLKALWSEPSNNYKQRTLLLALHAVGAKDEQVRKLLLMIAHGKLDQALLGAVDCKMIAVELIAASDMSDEEINGALLVSVVGRYQGYQTTDRIVERVQEGKLPAEKATAAFMTIFVDEAKRNRHDQGSIKALTALGADAANAVPALKAMRMHANPTIRADVKTILDSIERAMALKAPEEKTEEIWEITEIQKNGRASIKSGERELQFSPKYDHVGVFDSAGKQLRDDNAIRNAIKIGTRLKVRFEKERIQSVQLVE